MLQLVHHAAGFFPSTLLPASSAFREIAATAKSLILKAARAVNSGRPLDSAGMFTVMAQAWDRGMAMLDAA